MGRINLFIASAMLTDSLRGFGFKSLAHSQILSLFAEEILVGFDLNLLI